MPPTSEETPVLSDLFDGRSFGFGQLGASSLGTFTLADGGTIRGSRHPNESTWHIDEAGHLVFADLTGRVTTRFTAAGVHNGRFVLAGEFLDTGVIHYLCAPARAGDPSPPVAVGASGEPPGIDDLTAPLWGLGRLGEGVVTELHVLPDGRVRGSGSSNEARWELADAGRLLLQRLDGQATTSFDTLVSTSRGHAWVGSFGDGQTVHYLVPLFDPNDPGAVPPRVARAVERSQSPDENEPPLLRRERYVQSRRHLFGRATGNVFPATGVDSEARVAALRKTFDEVLVELGIDPEGQFRAGVKGSDSTALFDYVAVAKPATCLQVGTNAGFSTLLVADALGRSGGGHLTVIDPEIPQTSAPAAVDAVRRVAAHRNLDGHCTFVRGWASAMSGEPAHERWKHTVPVVGQSVLSELGPIDLVVIDDESSISATIADFVLVKDAVAEDGVVAFCDVLGRAAVTDAVEIILGEGHHAHLLWEVDVNTGPDGLVVLRRRSPPRSPALTVEVVDSVSGAPVPAAHVTAIGYDTAVASNRGEAVLFREIPAGAFIEVVAPGYRRERIQLADATDGTAVRTTIRLSRES